MHIVFVEIGYPKPSGIVGGAGTYVQIFSRKLVESGYEVSILTGKRSDGVNFFKDGNIDVYCVVESLSIHYYLSKFPIFHVFSLLVRYLEMGWKIYRELYALNNKKKIDIIEYSEGGDFWNAVFKKYKFVTHLHGASYTFKLNSGMKVTTTDWLQRKAEHFFIKRANAIVSPCQAILNLVSQETGAQLKESYVIPYPLDPNYIEINPNYNEKSKNEDIVIFFASRNDPIKGGELLLDAVKLLPDKIKNNVKIEFYGYKPRQPIDELFFLSCFDFLTRSELLTAYQRADICIIPSFFDNSPNTVYEAMINGKIVVASNVGGIPEILGSPPNGFLFERGNKKDLLVNLEKAIKLVQTGRHIEVGKAARKHILNLSDMETNFKKRIDLYLKLNDL